MTYRKFKVGNQYYNKLASSERKMLKILEGVVKDISVVYDLQVKVGFYPKGITKERLEKEARTNPELLSPFTYVEEKNGKLEAIPYHIHDAKYLVPISKKIENAANISTNKFFKLYLRSQAKSLLVGNYTEAFKLWLNVKNSKIDFYIGFFQRYLDKVLFIKRTFQGYAGIINEKATELFESYKETLYSSAKLGFSKYHSTDIPRKGVSVLIESITVIAGYPADILASGEHFPSNLDMALQYGSKVIIYDSQVKLKFEKLYYPIFKIIFEPRFASRYSKELLLEASGWCIFLYELGEELHKFEGVGERLQEFYDPIEKANGFASGIEHSKHLVVKGLISQEMLEAIIIIHIVWMIADWLLYKDSFVKRNHIIGNSILLNSYLLSGALRESGSISWPNFSRIFFGIEEMAYKLTYLLQKGSYQEASQFIKQNADLNSFKKLSKRLSKINTQI